jgi:hypothetical protein
MRKDLCISCKSQCSLHQTGHQKWPPHIYCQECVVLPWVLQGFSRYINSMFYVRSWSYIIVTGASRTLTLCHWCLDVPKPQDLCCLDLWVYNLTPPASHARLANHMNMARNVEWNWKCGMERERGRERDFGNGEGSRKAWQYPVKYDNGMEWELVFHINNWEQLREIKVSSKVSQ